MCGPLPLPTDSETILLLPADIGSHRRRNVYRWVIERYVERFAAVYDIPGNHYAYGGTPWETCEAPALLSNDRFEAILQDDRFAAATLWADFQRGNPVVEQACRVGMNDFRQIGGMVRHGRVPGGGVARR